ncbi:MAG TPA: hypothetical protein PLH02_01430 [Bacillota bacterium]|nr:hypothetical protein [Bacillota bacterium]HPF42080.1 hypothetical protein [Bacillota bacterium]HPJ85802.1 hypothetical protein [Bacillota bacterium]HPQ61527.1 hypothetical protein [Bacillota bacterium]HRX91338.1 hypothetical protein [Candidatus Izemoplasmatales bacterium]
MKFRRILACVNDGLLAIRIQNILRANGLSPDIASHPIQSDEAGRYDIVVIHESYRITDLYGFTENIVTRKNIPVVFLSSNPAGAILRRLSSYPGFMLADEMKMDSELPVILVMYDKYLEKNKALENENRKAKSKIANGKLFQQCKEYLISTGMSEDEAHKKILKTAMDEKIGKYDAALKILQKKTK